MIVAGVDPGGHDGALVVLRARSVLWWGSWSRVSAGFRLSGGPAVVPSLFAVGSVFARSVAEWAPMPVVVEGLFRGVPLAEAAGELVGPLRSVMVGGAPVARPGSSVWRPAVLRIPGNTDADRAGAVAQTWALGLDWPGGFPLWLTVAKEREAVAEAAAMAWWGANRS